MKKTILLLFLGTAAIIGCNKESKVDPNSSSYDKTLLIGWWTSDVAKNGMIEYKKRFFGSDSTMIIDESNFGLGTTYAKWWWLKKDSIYVTGNGSSRAIIKNLTKDSLCINWIDFNRTLYYYR
jgi:hypothetical protein